MKRYIIILLILANTAHAQTFTIGMRNDSAFYINNGIWTFAPRGLIFSAGHLLGLEVMRIRNDSLFTVINNVWTYKPDGSTYVFAEGVGTHPIGMEGGTTNQYLKKGSNADWDFIWQTPPTTLAGYGITDAAAINHNHAGVYEPVVNAGTTAQYLRGDKSWQTLNSTAVGLGNVSNNAQLTIANNLSDLNNASTARTNLGVNTTANIAASTNKNFVTDAQATVIGNTSGTNTGDQTTVSGNAGTATTLQTARKINFQSFNGSADIINKAIVANTAVVTGTANRTITGAQIVAGNIQELTGTVGRTFTFDTGTNMSTAAGTVTVGDTYYILIKSSGTSSGAITLAGATGMTLTSSAVIAIGTSRMVAIINTGTNAWTIY